MTATITNQYRPVAATETDVNRTLSVRTIRDLAESINNARYWVMNHKTHPCIFHPALNSPDASATKEVTVVWAPTYIPSLYTHLRWYLSHELTLQDGAEETSWTLYASQKLYRGPLTFDADYLGLPYTSSQIDDGSTSPGIGTGLLPIVRDARNLTYLTLTAQNESTGTKGTVYSMDATPQRINQ
jgi:hypothetical protein